MKIGAIPETILEWLALRLGLVPTPLVDTSATFILAHAVIAATQLGIFEALAARALGAAEVAAVCGTDLAATQRLLDALASSGYLYARSSRYLLTPASRAWVLKASPTSLYDAILFAAIEWDWMAHLSEFVRNGTPLDFHAAMTAEQWALYQRAMRALATIGAPELARRLPVPPGARTLLDIGGSHGYYSVMISRRYPRLRATILDLPEAIAHAAPLLASERMGDRIAHRAGNALVDDFGVEAYDLVLIAQLVHHFDAAQNRDLVRRAARALRPGGYLAVLEAIRVPAARAGGQIAGLLDLYFAFTSLSGTWALDDIVAWQRAAGLRPRKVIRFLKMPGIGAQVAVKPT
jgi:SAM-dependent methyltransferase